MGAGKKRQALIRIEEGEKLLRRLSHRWKKRLGEGDDRWVPPIGEGKREQRVPVWD
jgi:hypothetical protein